AEKNAEKTKLKKHDFASLRFLCDFASLRGKSTYLIVSRYAPVDASISTEKFDVPTLSPQTTRQAGSGCLDVFSRTYVMGLPGFFFSYSVALLCGVSSAVLYAVGVSTLTAI